MRQLIVKQLDYDLTPVAGLALVGHYLKAVAPVLTSTRCGAAGARAAWPTATSCAATWACWCRARATSTPSRTFRGDKFYKHALGIGLLPSSPTLRQRMDAQADALFDRMCCR